ncbi:MAG: hypothetical protein ACLFPN_03310, partial [Methanomassiliicoccales archaeon]
MTKTLSSDSRTLSTSEPSISSAPNRSALLARNSSNLDRSTVTPALRESGKCSMVPFRTMVKPRISLSTTLLGTSKSSR